MDTQQGRTDASPSTLGRYLLGPRIGGGGMAAVFVGWVNGPLGFTRPVAIKRLHPPFAEDPQFVAMMLDEARICGQVIHPHVVPVLDLVAADGQVAMILEYVHGLSLREVADHGAVPAPIACAIAHDALLGLHAAHEAVSPEGKRLGVVHRDVSPHNILVGADGIARIGDFGIAKAVWRLQGTVDGQLKGKLAYLSPEQIDGAEVDRRADVYGMGIVLWEMLTGERLFETSAVSEVVARVHESIRPPSVVCGSVAVFDGVLGRALARSPADRFETAEQMAEALRDAMAPAHRSEVAAWLGTVGEDLLRRRRGALAARPASETALADVPGHVVAAGDATEVEVGAAPVLARPRATGNTSRRLIGTGMAASLVVLLATAGWLAERGEATARDRDSAPAARSINGRLPAATVPENPEPDLDPNLEPAGPVDLLPAVARPVELLDAVAPAAPVATLPAQRVARPRAPASVKATPTPAASASDPCDPPFTVDADGVKMYKAECL